MRKSGPSVSVQHFLADGNTDPDVRESQGGPQ